MAIAIQCPKCRKQLSLNEKWAGKRVACMHCKSPVLVPVPLSIDDDEGEELEPRKGKKKQNNAALIGGSIVGVVTLILLIIVYVIFTPKARQNVEKAEQEKLEKGRSKPRTIELNEAKEILTKIANGYAMFSDKHSRGPKDLGEMQLAGDARVVELVEEKKWIVVPFGGMDLNKVPDGVSNTVLAYETEATKSKRAVIMGDRKFLEMDEETFNRTPRVLGTQAGGDPQSKPAFVPKIGISRFKERLKVQQWLRALGLDYAAYAFDKGKSPSKLQDLLATYPPEFVQAIANNEIVVHWNLRRDDVDSKVIAYEAFADGNGKRWVAVNNSVQEIEEDAFIKLMSK